MKRGHRAAWNDRSSCCNIGLLSRRIASRASPDASAGGGETAIDLAQLQRAVTFVDPSAILVPARILRRVIKRDRGLWFLRGRTSRRLDYTIAGAHLDAIVDPEEVGRPATEPWPKSVTLLAQPDPEELSRSDSGALLTRVWRQLFRTHVRLAILRMIESAALDATELSTRMKGIGTTSVLEARDVLVEDGLLRKDDSDADFYREFASAFLDMSYFAPVLRSHCFPAIENLSSVEALLARDVDGAGLLTTTKPPGALLPADKEAAGSRGPEPDPSADEVPWPIPDDPSEDEDGLPRRGYTDSASGKLSRRAEQVAARGNDVRAAILHTKAATLAPAEHKENERAKARSALKQLTQRLQKALFIRKGESELWAEALTPLLRRASRGFWSPEARLLFDLQKVCVDHEREVYRLDTLGWLFSFGKKPLRHSLPHLREVTTSNHLRSAARRMPHVALSRDDRARLELLLRPAVRHAEHALREQFRPWIDSTLESTWVRPHNLPERVAYRKLVEELLDQIVARGFLTLGDFRDAASRSNLKMNDLKVRREFIDGDRLLNADRALAESLDGVHRKGEVYLRTLQRFSALAFGTRTGRFLTLFAALPFGGAFVALIGVQELNELVVSRLTGLHSQIDTFGNVIMLGMLALAAINVRRFRSEFLSVLRSMARLFHTVFVALPGWILRNPVLLRIITSPLFKALWQLAGKPFLLAFAAWQMVHFLGRGATETRGVSLVVFVASCFVLNTKAGRRVEEFVSEGIIEAWRELAGNLIPGLFRAVMEVFERFLEWVEKVIYAVDEWLRFREGQSRVALVGKAAMGLVWGVVAYLVRIYVNLLIEPQVNPIKHFPVVTVSHKVMLPFIGHLTGVAEGVLIPFFGTWAGKGLAWANVLLLPGFFGFLVWELKSNWRLYEANRAASLEQIVVGSHGENVVRLLRPGFHSGTLPKLFAKLRRAESTPGRDKAVVKRRAALHHVEESFRRFVERDVIALLHESRTLGDASIHAGSIHLATNSIRIDLVSEGDDQPPVRIEYVEQQGVLTASITQVGWMTRLNPEARHTLVDALVGLYKMSGIQSVIQPDGEGRRAVDLDGVAVNWTTWVEAWAGEISGDRPAKSGSSFQSFGGFDDNRVERNPVFLPVQGSSPSHIKT